MPACLYMEANDINVRISMQLPECHRTEGSLLCKSLMASSGKTAMLGICSIGDVSVLMGRGTVTCYICKPGRVQDP